MKKKTKYIFRILFIEIFKLEALEYDMELYRITILFNLKILKYQIYFIY